MPSTPSTRSKKPSPRRHLLKFLTASFILFLIIIIVIATRGEGGRWWSFIHNIPYGDKLGHIGLTATLSLLCNLAFTKKPLSFLPTRTTLILSLIVSLEEISQAFIPSRNFDPLDLLANLTGLALGQLAAMAFNKLFPITINQ